MTQTTHPPKHLVREYLERRTHYQTEPPPSPDEIRRELGWHLLPELRQPDRQDRDDP
jgi:hypothetical protein